MTRVAFDIGGVLSKYPDVLRSIARALIAGGVDVYVITDMHPHTRVIETLKCNGFDFIQPDRVIVADYETYGEGCKAHLLEQLGIDVMFDDFIGYVADPSASVRCLVLPDSSRPYYHETWKVPDGEPDFGRRTYRRRS